MRAGRLSISQQSYGIVYCDITFRLAPNKTPVRRDFVDGIDG